MTKKVNVSKKAADEAWESKQEQIEKEAETWEIQQM